MAIFKYFFPREAEVFTSIFSGLSSDGLFGYDENDLNVVKNPFIKQL